MWRRATLGALRPAVAPWQFTLHCRSTKPDTQQAVSGAFGHYPPYALFVSMRL